MSVCFSVCLSVCYTALHIIIVPDHKLHNVVLVALLGDDHRKWSASAQSKSTLDQQGTPGKLYTWNTVDAMHQFPQAGQVQ